MKRAILVVLFCLLILTLGCQKKIEPVPAPTPGEQSTDVSEIEDGLSDADAIEELDVGDDLDEDFLNTLDW